MKARSDSWAAYWLWCLAGAGLCFGVLSILTVGPFVLLVTLGLCAWLLWRVDFGWGMLGLLSGAALPLLYVAWLNRDQFARRSGQHRAVVSSERHVCLSEVAADRTLHGKRLSGLPLRR